MSGDRQRFVCPGGADGGGGRDSSRLRRLPDEYGADCRPQAVVNVLGASRRRASPPAIRSRWRSGRVPEASRILIIRPDGFVTPPIRTTSKAAGLTAREPSERLNTLFATPLVRPQASVITMVRQPVVHVAGRHHADDGTAAYRRHRDGGDHRGRRFRRSGSEGDVTIIRLAETGYLEAIPSTAGRTGQPGLYLALAGTPLQPDDIVFVPEHGAARSCAFPDDIVLKPLQMILNYKLIKQLNSP